MSQAASRVKRILLSYSAVLAVGVAILGLHLWWFFRAYSEFRPEAIAGFGAALVVLSIWVAARPFIRRGIDATAADALPQLHGFLVPDSYDREREAKRPQARRDVITERVLAVAGIAIGTLLNGYAGPIARGLEATLKLFPLR